MPYFIEPSVRTRTIQMQQDWPRHKSTLPLRLFLAQFIKIFVAKFGNNVIISEFADVQSTTRNLFTGIYE